MMFHRPCYASDKLCSILETQLALGGKHTRTGGSESDPRFLMPITYRRDSSRPFRTKPLPRRRRKSHVENFVQALEFLLQKLKACQQFGIRHPGDGFSDTQGLLSARGLTDARQRSSPDSWNGQPASVADPIDLLNSGSAPFKLAKDGNLYPGWNGFQRKQFILMHIRSPRTPKTPARSKCNRGKGTTRFRLI
jgi:hypothetical protein